MFSFLLGVHAVSGISELDSKCTIKFIRNCKLFSKVTIPFLILTGNCRPSSCSTYLTVCIVSLFILAILLQKMGPFQDLGVGSCLTLRNELSKETHKLTKQKTIGKGHLYGEQQGKRTRRMLCHAALRVRFCSNGVSFEVVSGQYLTWPMYGDSRSFRVARASLSQDGCQPEGFRKVGRTFCLLPPQLGPS